MGDHCVVPGSLIYIYFLIILVCEGGWWDLGK